MIVMGIIRMNVMGIIRIIWMNEEYGNYKNEFLL